MSNERFGAGVISEGRVDELNVTFRVYAHRKLTADELRTLWASFRRTAEGKRITPGATYEWTLPVGFGAEQ